MYVDKVLSGVKAVQALSRLNRAHPGKKDTFILDFANDPEAITKSFQPYYRTTLLAEETDPNKLHDMRATLDDAGVYTEALVVDFVDKYLDGVPRPALDAMLDTCVGNYKDLDEEGQVAFKGTAKAFVRTYNFLAQILPWGNAGGSVSRFSCRSSSRACRPRRTTRARSARRSSAPSISTVTAPRLRRPSTPRWTTIPASWTIPTRAAALPPEAEKDLLSHILQTFNEIFADADFTDADRVAKQMSGPVMDALVGDEGLRQIAASTDEQNQRIAFADALDKMVNANWQDNYEVLQRLGDDPQFRDAFGSWMFRLWRTRVNDAA